MLLRRFVRHGGNQWFRCALVAATGLFLVAVSAGSSWSQEPSTLTLEAPAAGPEATPAAQAPQPPDQGTAASVGEILPIEGTVLFSQSPVTTSTPITAAGKLQVEEGGLVIIQLGAVGRFLLSAVPGEAGMLEIGAVDATHARPPLKLISGNLAFSVGRNATDPIGFEVSLEGASTSLNGVRGIARVQKAEGVVAVRDGELDVRSMTGTGAVHLTAEMTTRCVAGKDPGEIVQVVWDAFVQSAGFPPAHVPTVQSMFANPSKRAGADSRTRIGCLIAVLIYLAARAFPAGGMRLVILALVAFGLEAGLGISRLWVNVKFADLPLGALAFGVVVVTWARAEQSSRGKQRAGFGLALSHVLKISCVWAIALLSVGGPAVFELTGAAGFLHSLRRLLAPFTGWTYSAYYGQPEPVFTYEVMAALFPLMWILIFEDRSPTCQFCKGPLVEGARSYATDEDTLAAPWAMAMKGQNEAFLTILGSGLNKGPGRAATLSIEVTWCRACVAGKMAVRRVMSTGNKDSKSIELRGNHLNALVVRLLPSK